MDVAVMLDGLAYNSVGNSVLVQTVAQPSAVLDLRFQTGSGSCRQILASVSSTGTLSIFRLDPSCDNASWPLQHITTSRCADLGEDILFLQCCWHPNLERVIAVTTSSGLARLLHLGQDWNIESVTEVGIQNSLEAWSIAFSPQPSVLTSLYCGGDDSVLRYTLCQASGEPAFAPVSIRGQHNAGVTAILPLALHASDGGRLVVTGSYDDRLRVLAIHDLDESHGVKRVRLAGECNLEGGVWRLSLVRMHPTIRVLASCMHAGVRLCDLSSEDGLNWTCRVVARFQEHKSMNYACDFVADGERLLCASSSFYDRLLCLWEFDGLAQGLRS